MTLFFSLCIVSPVAIGAICVAAIILLALIYGIWLYFFIHGRTQTLSSQKYEVEVTELTVDYETKKLWGRFYRPIMRGKVPVVICSHGFGANYRTTETLIANTLSRSGIACICFDFYGGNNKSKSGGTMSEMSPLTEKGDLLAVMKEVEELSFVDSERIYLFGESQGGFVSALAANEVQDKLKGLVLYYPAFCIPDMAKEICKNGIPESHKIFKKIVSEKYFEDSIGIDVYEIIKSFEKPVLIIHGNADKVVDISYGKKAAQVYPNAKFIELDKQYHGFSGKGKMKAVKFVYDFIQGK